jgi:hypothetical protein
MHNYKKAIVALDGTSSKINNKEILNNIRYSLNALQIPFEVYKSHSDGFKKLQKDMNQDDTLYILNDSLQFHLCEKPNIIISRSTPWVQATPKSCTIGVFTQEMISHEVSQLIACIDNGLLDPINEILVIFLLVIRIYCIILLIISSSKL